MSESRCTARCIMWAGSNDLPIKFTAQQDQATVEERLAGSMEQVLTATIGYGEGTRVAQIVNFRLHGATKLRAHRALAG
jgi:cell division GTPase FtsZ